MMTNPRYFLYTDGSFNHKNHHKTVSAFIVLDESGTVVRKGRDYVRAEKEWLHSAMVSELRAVLMGLKAIKKLDTSDSVTVKIITDYQGIVDFHRLMRKKSKHKIKKEKFQQELHQHIWNWYYANLCNIMASYRQYGKELILEVEWIKGHSGHYWNEQVDTFSKKKIEK